MTLPAISLTGLPPLVCELKPWDILFSFLVDAKRKRRTLLIPAHRADGAGEGRKACYLSSEFACSNFGVQMIGMTLVVPTVSTTRTKRDGEGTITVGTCILTPR